MLERLIRINVRMSPVLSVVVPVYEQWDLILPRFIDAILQQSLQSEFWELILVDNDSVSTPDFTELERKFKNLSCYSCKKPGSYAARNMGISSARGDYILFTDADCIPHKDWLHETWVAINKEKNSYSKLIAGAIELVDLDGSRLTSAGLYDAMLGLPQERYSKKGKAATANLLIPKKVFEDIGLFDDSRFSGGDHEFCSRAKENGLQLVFEKSAVVYHPVRNDIAELKRKRRRVKGGQIKNGTAKNKAFWSLRTFFPPVRAAFYIFSKKGYSVREKCRALYVCLRLWLVDIQEMLRLYLGGKPERR